MQQLSASYSILHIMHMSAELLLIVNANFTFHLLHIEFEADLVDQ